HEHLGSLAVHRRAGRLGGASGWPGRGREIGIPHRFRDRSAVGGGTGGGPHALYLPEPVAEPVPAGRHRQMGPAHAALDGMGTGHQEPLLLPLQIHQPRGLRRTARKEGRQQNSGRGSYRLRRVLGMSMNLGKVDPRSLIGTGKVGLLTSSGTYDVERYPWAYECWKRQQQTHWMGEEVPLGADIKDWQSGHLTEAEKGLLTQIFRFFTQSDVEVGDNYLKRYIPIFQPLEVQMMMAAFTNMETVHID